MFYKPQNLKKKITYSKEELDFINLIPKGNKHAWDGDLTKIGLSNKTRNELKVSIKKKLTFIQEEFCIYCGISFKIVGIAEREHIAPKGRYPTFTFEVENIALSCSYCNGPLKKHIKNTISTFNEVYKDCAFTIVHPYFNNYEDEIEFTFNGTDLFLSPKNGSIIGEKTILIFKLMEPIQAALRAGQIMRQAKVLKVEEEIILAQIRNNKYY